MKVGGRSPEQEAPGADGAWVSLAVLAGGAERLDSALLDAVAPAVREARGRDQLVESWFFERFVDERGPQLRVHVRAPGWSEEQRTDLAERLREGLGRAGAESPRKPLLPIPPSYRNGAGQTGVEAGDPPDEDAAERLSHVSSEAVVEALPLLEDGRERAAFALLLATALSDAALEHGEWERFWSTVARSWVGEGPRGERLLEQLEARAAELAPELLAGAREVARRPAVGSALGRYARACQELTGEAPDELVARHAHMTSNRLGLVPLEETLVALLLAGGMGDRIEVSDGPDGGTSTVGPEVVRVRGVGKDGSLEDVAFEVHEGEVFGLLGRDGAGKSTLLGIAAGLRVPSAGAVEVLGEDPQEQRDGLAVGLPDGELAEDATVRENLELRAALADGGDAPDAVLGEIGLSDKAGTRVGELERGERRTLAIGCALMGDPRVLFLDEPTSGLSPTEREQVWELVRRQRERGRTVVLATTSLQDARAICDRVALLSGGKLAAVGDPEGVAREQFEKRKVRFDTEAEPDRALLEDLPEVISVRIEQLHPDHWSVEATTAQPAELMKVLGADPAFPWVVHLRAEDLE